MGSSSSVVRAPAAQAGGPGPWLWPLFNLFSYLNTHKGTLCNGVHWKWYAIQWCHVFLFYSASMSLPPDSYNRTPTVTVTELPSLQPLPQDTRFAQLLYHAQHTIWVGTRGRSRCVWEGKGDMERRSQDANGVHNLLFELLLPFLWKALHKIFRKSVKCHNNSKFTLVLCGGGVILILVPMNCAALLSLGHLDV